MRILESSNTRDVEALIDRRARRSPAVERRVARIVADVRERGDAALLEYARTLDGLVGSMEVTRTEMKRAVRTVPSASVFRTRFSPLSLTRTVVHPFIKFARRLLGGISSGDDYDLSSRVDLDSAYFQTSGGRSFQCSGKISLAERNCH